MSKIDDDPSRTVRYIVHDESDEREIDEEKVEVYIEIFYRYLSDFISKENLRKDIINCFKNGRVVCAYLEDGLIGAVAGVYTPFFDRFHIAHIAVGTEFRRQGIGEELIRKVIPEGKGASVHLNVENPEIKKFYEDIGFIETHIRFIKDDDEEG